jgi:hypothetical protein
MRGTMLWHQLVKSIADEEAKKLTKMRGEVGATRHVPLERG